MQLLPTARPDLDAAEVVSDSLSDTTPFASPRGEVPPALTGATAPQATEEATPGFTPPATPVADQDGAGAPYITPPSAIAPLPWQDACSPSSAPAERNSWLMSLFCMRGLVP